MLKLLTCIVGIFIICAVLLQLRQVRLAERHAINALNVRLSTSQATLWNQQLEIAAITTPQVLVRQMRQAANTPQAPGVRQAASE